MLNKLRYRLRSLWKKFKNWYEIRQIARLTELGKEPRRITPQTGTIPYDITKLPKVKTATKAEVLGRDGMKVDLHKEIVYTDGSKTSYEVVSNEDSQRAFHDLQMAQREAQDKMWKSIRV